MSATFATTSTTEIAVVDLAGDGERVTATVGGRLTVADALEVRRSVTEALATLPLGGRGIVDLSGISELDAAGLAAVTAPVFAHRRRGCRIAVLPPEAPEPRRFAGIVGVLPIGVG